MQLNVIEINPGRAPFPKTECACKECVQACAEPGYLMVSDIAGLHVAKEFQEEVIRLIKETVGEMPEDMAELEKKIPEKTQILLGAIIRKMGLEFAEEHLEASTATKVMVKGEVLSVPTIVPRKKDGVCHWLKNERCSIHENKPFGCAYFDRHQSKRESDARSSWALKEIIEASSEESLVYLDTWKHLVLKGIVKEGFDWKTVTELTGIEMVEDPRKKEKKGEAEGK